MLNIFADQQAPKNRLKFIICIILLLIILALILVFIFSSIFSNSPPDAASKDANATSSTESEANSEQNKTDASSTGAITCTKNSNGVISCTDESGHSAMVECNNTSDGLIECIDSDGKTIEPILVDNSSNSEDKNQDDEVVKEVIKEKEVYIDKTSPVVVARHQNPTDLTNGDVTLALIFNKEVKLPTGWTYGSNKKEIRRVFSDNVNNILSVADLANNLGQVNISIINIDKNPPKCGSHGTGAGSNYLYTITCDEAINIPDWNIVSDMQYNRAYTSSQLSLSVEITDRAGNKTTVSLP